MGEGSWPSGCVGAVGRGPFGRAFRVGVHMCVETRVGGAVRDQAGQGEAAGTGEKASCEGNCALQGAGAGSCSWLGRGRRERPQFELRSMICVDVERGSVLINLVYKVK